MPGPWWRVRRLVVLTVYLVAVFGFLELASRAALSHKGFFRRVAGVDQASSRLRWARRQERRPLVQPFDVYHPVRGWTLAPGLSGVPAFDGKRLSSTARGYRGQQEVPAEKPPGRVRVAVLGDSFTFGEGVGDEETWVHQLGVLRPALEPVNLGVHAYGHDQMLLTLREEGPRLRPDLVLVGFVHIDLERNRTGFFDYAKPRFDLDDGRLVLRNVPVPTPEELRAREVWRSKFLDLLSMLRARLRDRTGLEARARDTLGRALLEALRDATREVGARPVFVYLPILDEIGAPEPSPGERFFEASCHDSGLTCLNLRPSFLERTRSGQRLRRRGHWGPNEHRAAAEDLVSLLDERGVMPKPATAAP
ncbi:MAG: SGNH/GDSL hydrolase family protein [Acidobacteriota bacterium]